MASRPVRTCRGKKATEQMLGGKKAGGAATEQVLGGKKAGGAATEQVLGGKKAGGDSTVPVLGEKKAGGDSTEQVLGEKKAGGDSTVQVLGEKKAGGDSTEQVLGGKKAGGDSTEQVLGGKKAGGAATEQVLGGKRASSCSLPDSTNKKKKEATNAVVTNSREGHSTSPYFKDDAHKPDEKLTFSFYDIPCQDLAEALLGQRLVHKVDGKRFSGVIVETEAYLGPEDKAAHSYQGKQTPKNEAMFMPPGTAYVYNIYGMYCCMNISSRGDGAAVLLRALEPDENMEDMAKVRCKDKTKVEAMLKKKGKDLCNGPSKLCQALSIDKASVNKQDMVTSGIVWLERGNKAGPATVVKCKRININYAEDWIDKPLRYYIKGNPCVSVKDKQAEAEMDG